MTALPPQGPQFQKASVQIFRCTNGRYGQKPDHTGTSETARAWLEAQGPTAWPNFLVKIEGTGHIETAQRFMSI